MSLPLPPRAVRRAVIDPLWLPIACALELLLLVVVALSALVRPVTPRARVLRLATFAAVYLALDVGLLLSAFGLWLRHPSPRRDREAWDVAHCRLLMRALDRLDRTAARALGYSVDLRANDAVPSGDRPLIVLARHAGIGDSFTLAQLLLTTLHRRPRVVLKSVLQWDPGLDVVLNRLSNCFIPSRTGAGDDRTAALRSLARSLGGRDALLLFPEGANWTPRRHNRAVSRLFRTGRLRAAHLAEMQPRVLPPRPAGTVTCLEARPDADVLLVAHSGLDTLTTVRDVWRALPLRDRPMRIDWHWFAAAEVPRDPDGAQRWLAEQWIYVHTWVTTHDTARPAAPEQSVTPRV